MELGCEVVCASEGAEALEAIRREQFDLVISDVVMPEMDGLELARRLEEEAPDLPLILATGYSEDVVRRARGRPLLHKPYRIGELAKVIAAALERAPDTTSPG